jgi:hypothetical protein
MAFCDRQFYYYYFVCLFLFWFCTPLNRGAGATIFWLFVTKMPIQRDNDVLPSNFLSSNAASAESGGQPEVVK